MHASTCHTSAWLHTRCVSGTCMCIVERVCVVDATWVLHTRQVTHIICMHLTAGHKKASCICGHSSIRRRVIGGFLVDFAAVTVQWALTPYCAVPSHCIAGRCRKGGWHCCPGHMVLHTGTCAAGHKARCPAVSLHHSGGAGGWAACCMGWCPAQLSMTLSYVTLCALNEVLWSYLLHNDAVCLPKGCIGMLLVA